MKTDVYVAKRSTPLRDILRVMQQRKLGSTVIVNNSQEVLGIFTVIDALGILADLLDDDDEAGDLYVDEFFDSWESGTVA